MAKNLLLSTVLTAAVSCSVIASAADNVTSTNTTPLIKKISKEDAYNPKQYGLNDQMDSETVVVFAEAPKQQQQAGNTMINSDGLSIKLGGKVNVQYGFASQRAFFKNPSNNEALPQSEDYRPTRMLPIGSSYANQNALVSNGELTFAAEKIFDSCNKYGLEIVADANASAASSGNPSFANKVFIYIENPGGRFELGANDGASETMSYSATKIAKGTGGIDGDYATWIPYSVVGGRTNDMLEDTFLTNPSLPYAYQYAKKANKLTYYTPTYNGFQGGLSYSPDVTVRGTTYEALSFKGSGYVHVIEYGLSYANKFDDVGLGLSFSGQIGDARPAFIMQSSANAPLSFQSQPLQNLGAWHIGGQVSYDAFTLAGSYCDWGVSGTVKNPAPNTPSKQANFWTTGLAYDYQDKGGLSVTYMQSTRRGAFSMKAYDYVKDHPDFDSASNQYDAVSVGGEYKVMPGLMPYAEFTAFNYSTSLIDAKTNKGSVVLAGLKLNF